MKKGTKVVIGVVEIIILVGLLFLFQFAKINDGFGNSGDSPFILLLIGSLTAVFLVVFIVIFFFIKKKK
ncbi:hypothetical protein [Candidatus Lokiarchaeum ossiferum]|uniref:hypothetical protein n=1 Tax=Candidatus Lokiarchaeum ossiferum TaxID=2951803 RepID=UPI00352EA536